MYTPSSPFWNSQSDILQNFALEGDFRWFFTHFSARVYTPAMISSEEYLDELDCDELLLLEPALLADVLANVELVFVAGE